MTSPLGFALRRLVLSAAFALSGVPAVALAGCALLKAEEPEEGSVAVWGSREVPTGAPTRSPVRKFLHRRGPCPWSFTESRVGDQCIVETRDARLRPERVTCPGATCSLELDAAGWTDLVVDRETPGTVSGMVVVADVETGEVHEVPFTAMFVPSRLRVERCDDDGWCGKDVGDGFSSAPGIAVRLGVSVAKEGESDDALVSDPAYDPSVIAIDASGTEVTDVRIAERRGERYLGPGQLASSRAKTHVIAFDTPGRRLVTYRFGRLTRTVEVDVSF